MIGAVLIPFDQSGDYGVFPGRRDKFNAVSVFDQEADIDLADIVMDGILLNTIAQSQKGLFGLFYFFD